MIYTSGMSKKPKQENAGQFLPPRKPKTDVSTPGEIKTYTVGRWITAKDVLVFWRWEEGTVSSDDPNWQHVSWRTTIQADCAMNAVQSAEHLYRKQIEAAA